MTREDLLEKGIRFAKTNALNIILLLFIAYGVIIKFFLVLNRQMDSDIVYYGLVSMEIGKHHNYFLDGYTLSYPNNAFFTNILPFHLLPQILSNYNPTMINIVGYLQFVLILIVFSYIVYRFTGDLTRSLLFAALFASLSTLSFVFYSMTGYHITTILAIGLLLLVTFNSKLRGLNLDILEKGHRIWLVVLFILVSLFIVSDGLVIIFFVVPLTAVYVIHYCKKPVRSAVLIGAAAGYAVLMFALGKIIPTLPGGPTFDMLPSKVRDLNDIITVSIPTYLNGIILLFNGELYKIANGLKTIDALDLVIIIATIIIGYYVIASAIGAKKALFHPLALFFIVPSIVIFFADIFTILSIGVISARYFSMTMLAVFMLIAIVYNPKYRLFTVAILALLACNALGNYNDAQQALQAGQPNISERELISYLAANNMTYGYADYWDANVITYLSNEKVTLRPVYVEDAGLKTAKFLAVESWYDSKPARFIVIVNTENKANTATMENLSQKYRPAEAIDHYNYKVYVYEDSAPLRF